MYFHYQFLQHPQSRSLYSHYFHLWIPVFSSLFFKHPFLHSVHACTHTYRYMSIHPFVNSMDPCVTKTVGCGTNHKYTAVQFKVLQIWYKTWQSQVSADALRSYITAESYVITVFSFHGRIGQWWLTHTIMEWLQTRLLVVSLFGMTHNGLFRWVRKVSILCSMVRLLNWACLAQNFTYQSVTLHIEITRCLTTVRSDAFWCDSCWSFWSLWCLLLWAANCDVLYIIWCTVHYVMYCTLCDVLHTTWCTAHYVMYCALCDVLHTIQFVLKTSGPCKCISCSAWVCLCLRFLFCFWHPILFPVTINSTEHRQHNFIIDIDIDCQSLQQHVSVLVCYRVNLRV
jgi:hypothetical protein